MKAIINGKKYDTTTAKDLAKISADRPTSDFSYFEETLYLKRTGEYFLAGEGGPATKYATYGYGAYGWGEKIFPLTRLEALEWGEEKLSADEYIEIFGDPGEGEIVKFVTARNTDTWDTDILRIVIPGTKTEEMFKKDIKMAERYSEQPDITDPDLPCDGLYNYMQEFYGTTNGLGLEIIYLRKLGYKVEFFEPDLEMEWNGDEGSY